MYPIGVSAQPIDISSGARALSRTALETRLNEIAASQEEISENKKNILKAMSIKALPELARAQRDRYQEEIESYRQGVIDKFKDSGGKLTVKDQMDIQDGFVDMQERMKNEALQLKQFEQRRDNILLNPNSRYLYDLDKTEQVIGGAYERLMRGEGIGNFSADLAQTMRAPTISDYVGKLYGDAIKQLDVISKGRFQGNVFTSTTEQDKAELGRLRDEIMRDSGISNRYMNPDGSVNEEKKAETQQLVEDYIDRVAQDTKPYRQTTSGSRMDETFVSFTPDVAKVKTDKGDVDTTYKANVPLARLTSFNLGEDRVVAEAIQYVPVAKSRDAYNRNISSTEPEQKEGFEKSFYKKARKQGKLPDAVYSEHLIIDDKDLGKYKEGEYDYVPFVKLIQPKDKNIFFNSLEDLAGKKTEVQYQPFDGALRDNILSKMGRNRPLYEKRINEAQTKVGAKGSLPSQTTKTTYMLNGEEFTEEQLKSAGWTDEDLKRL